MTSVLAEPLEKQAHVPELEIPPLRPGHFANIANIQDCLQL